MRVALLADQTLGQIISTWVVIIGAAVGLAFAIRAYLRDRKKTPASGQEAEASSTTVAARWAVAIVACIIGLAVFSNLDSMFAVYFVAAILLTSGTAFILRGGR